MLVACDRTPEVRPLLYSVSYGKAFVGHVLGTIHYGASLAGHDAQAVNALVSKSRRLLVERDLRDRAFQASFEAAIARPFVRQSWAQVVGTNGLAAVANLGKRIGVDPLGASPAQMHPLLLAGMALRQCDPPDLKAGISMDADLQAQAAKAGVSVQALESAEEAAEAIAAVPPAAWAEYVIQADRFIGPSCTAPTADYIAATIHAYGSGDAAGVRVASLRMHQHSSLATVHTPMIYAREPRLATRIVSHFREAATQGGGPIFVTVGAAHLADQGGVLGQLRRAGFSVQLEAVTP
ncbi:MAG: TraB/GumN family protein [Pseudomonadota bacterium]